MKSVIKIRGELDKIANERKVITEKEGKDPSPAELRKIARKKDELEAREKEATSKRDELLNPELRAA